MKFTKRLLALAMIVMSVLYFTACDQHEIEGKWEGKISMKNATEDFIAAQNLEHLDIQYDELNVYVNMEFEDGEYTSKADEERYREDIEKFFDTCLRAQYDWHVDIEEFSGSYEEYISLVVGDWDEFIDNAVEESELDAVDLTGEYTYSDGILILDGDEDEEIEVEDGEFTIRGEDDIKIKYKKLEDEE